MSSSKGKSDSKAPMYQYDTQFYCFNVIFLVEDTLFRVPRNALEKNEDGPFAGLFTLPSGGAEPEGSSDANPIRLEGITAFDFRSFLKVIFPLPLTEPTTLSMEEWTSVLKLSTMWSFTALRAMAITQLTHLIPKSPDHPTLLVVLGKEFYVSKWLLEGYTSLAMRDTLPTEEERARLGGDTAWKLAEIREQIYPLRSRKVQTRTPAGSYGNGAGYMSEPGRYRFEKEIRERFKEELVKDEAYDPREMANDPSRAYFQFPSGMFAGDNRALEMFSNF